MAFGMVIAGGRSQRMGREKAAIVLAGRTLLERACARLARACEVVGVNTRGVGEADAIGARLGLPRISDPEGAPEGPLSGVLAGLRWTQANGGSLLVVVPCDAPFLPDDLAPRLIAAATQRGSAMARAGEDLQPLCSAWSVGMADDLERALAGERHPPVHRVLVGAGCAVVDFEDAAAFANLNTPEDLAAAEARIRQS